MRQSFILLSLCALSLAACKVESNKPITPVAPKRIAIGGDPKESYGTALRSIVKADLTIAMKDADAGVITTEWHANPKYEYKSIPFGVARISRRVRFTVIVEKGACTIKPEAQQLKETESGGGHYKEIAPWETVPGLNDEELVFWNNLSSNLEADLPKPATADAPTPAVAK